MSKSRKSPILLAAALSLIGFAATASAKMQIKSSAFANGSSIPSKFTCDAKMPPNPPLAFSGVPAKAQSLVLIMEDPDVPKNLMPSGVFDHWMVWNISPRSKGIKEGDSAQGINGTGKTGYVGPCPPDREHRYFFHLYALDTKLGDAKIANRKELEAAMKGHVIEQADLMGRYNRVKK
ncbi:MAG TPA: YbhB/YbcL family Raf kinase inhibitor-like protein [Candidatus Acidoferrales bacterium]|nr:YbhB/YbcL family Raf kinase inhibitor-like protein [Candidatus Acidoferrales bacterium]